MTIHSGGPHLLLFERDQQLTAVLMSELQLAGYECHAARTAVEVFDAIARFPIRLVLVNLAQAAAGRREFWVALDAQRRGRGVQVFTFRCMNIAGYGVDDPDERARIVLTDMEVDGMLGVMNLVDAVRARIPAAPSASSTGSFARVGASPLSRDSARLEAIRPVSQPGFGAVPMPVPPQIVQAAQAAQTVSQATAPLSALNPTPSAPMPAVPSASALSASAQPVAPPVPSQQQAASSTNLPQGAGMQPTTFTDKIRAVLRPGLVAVSPNPEANWVPFATPSAAGRRLDRPETENAALHSINGTTVAGQQAQNLPPVVDGAPAPVQQGEETGLAQLSRMVQDTVSDELPLRASPIEDLPVERLTERKNGSVGTTMAEAARHAPQLESINTSTVETMGEKRRALPIEEALPAMSPPSSAVDRAQVDQVNVSTTRREGEERIDAVLVEQVEQTTPENVARPEIAVTTAMPEVPGMPGISEALTAAALRRRSEHSVTSEDVLLNIVQSLPPMNALPTPAQPASPQVAVLSGRATRSLANVLIDGHLVPQDRLEVAQSIQRMLRGVDMNYQLGEILLMFKLLTPDQLLAASLVSYGMISAVQISALGRIRQELHSMGLEYDLESLLVLFRILSSDQLREVRSSWSG
ncbi:MAG TPA: hypothetical protein VGT44_06075 [Ktedonobacteraceae bacterium]|nr:hypothetical protein [Ktedonobacteraceae bacterium]